MKFLTLIFFLFSLSLSAQNFKNQTGKKYTWETGIGLCSPWVHGDVKAIKPSPGFGLSVQKSFVNWFAVQLQYSGAVMKGLSWTPAYNFAKNPAWAGKYNAPVTMMATSGPYTGQVIQVNSADKTTFYRASTADAVYYNYKTNIHQLSLQAKFSATITSIKPQAGFYVLLGTGVFIFNTKVDALDGQGNTYRTLFLDVFNSYEIRKSNKENILKALQKGLDGNYETKADQENNSPKINPLIGQVGGGVTVRLNNRIKIGVDYLLSLTRTDLLDGQRWKETSLGDAMLSKSFDLLENISINLRYSF